MNKLLVLLLTIFALNSCEQDTTIIDATAEKKLPKEYVCHYDEATGTWETLHINGNALKAHLDHGDIEGRCEDRKTYIPDDGFEWYLVYYGYDDAMDDYVLTANIENIESMFWDDACCTSPWVDWPYGEYIGQGIRVNNLIGIEDFTSLVYFHVYDHPVTEYNLELDRIPQLESFAVTESLVREIDFSQNPNLKLISFYNSSLLGDVLDLSNNPMLESINLYYFGMSEILDLSNNPMLESIHLEDVSMTGLNLKSGNNTNISYWSVVLGSSSRDICIQVDNVDYSTENWGTNYNFSTDCGF